MLRVARSGEADRAQEIVSNKIARSKPLEAKLVIDTISDNSYPAFTLPVHRNPLVSIIIPAYNEFAYTYSCINSVLKYTDVPYEVIVADDCSTDQTRNIGELIKNVIHIRNESNLRFLLNCNNAAKHARGEFIFFLNNDTQVQPNWVEPLVDLMCKNENIGLVGSKLVFPDKRLQEAGGILWKDGSAWNYGRLGNPENPEYNYVKDVDYISGAAIMVRKTIWEQLGGFDEQFAPIYCDDSDLAFSIRELGYRTVYQPKSVVVHFEGISSGTDINSGQKQYQVVNQTKFYKKWRHILERDHFPNGENVFQARDRSRYKKTVLFIDHYVPMFDQDAGSRTVYNYVNLFVEMGYHVIFLCEMITPQQPYTEILQQMGVQVLYGNWYIYNWKTWLKNSGGYIDYIFMNRPNVSIKYISYLKKYTKAKIMYYGHDLHSVRARSEYTITKDKGLLKEAAAWEKTERKLFIKSDIILTISQKEYDIIHGLFPDKQILFMPVFFYSEFPQIRDFKQRKSILFIGGFAHKPNIDGIIWFVSEIMPLVPNAHLIVVGSNPPHSVKALANKSIEIKGYVSDEELNRIYSECRVAVIPLRYGAGVKGKTIEAMHNLIPVVSTSYGIEGLPLDGLISESDSPADFASKVNLFMNSDEECKKTATAYRDWIYKWFSKERAIQILGEMTKG